MAAPLPPPTPGSAPLVYYRDYFSDASNDPFNGDYTAVLAPYGVPAADAMAPADLRNLAFNSRSQNVPTAFLLQHDDDGLLHIYLQLDRFNSRMGLPPTAWDNRNFIGKGDLHHNNHITVEWQNDYFNQSNQIRVPSTEVIDGAYAADANANILGPYVVADAGTEVIRVRRTCYVPPAYVPLFLAHPLSPRDAWLAVQAQVVIDGRWL